ncbi:MAG: cupin domain-containing protein [Fidelibacterota bacterium]|nr:MAG: cupin domain-containing protein [Candidatus Neomarinimicrobiota bacterium]
MQYVFGTTNLKRYQFPTHRNDLVMDRSEADTSEVFMVVLEPGQAPPLHQHEDIEQIFYILAGKGTLTIKGEEEGYPVQAGDVVRIPVSAWHAIWADKEEELRYLAVDCFKGAHAVDEPTWDDHVKVMCLEQGWDYEEVVR